MSATTSRRTPQKVTWNFAEDVVLITGAARGQGRSHALAFAEAGARLVLGDTATNLDTVQYSMATPEELKATAEDCRALGAEVSTVTCDVRDARQVQEMVDAAIGGFGKIDVLIANAGVVSVVEVVDMAEQAWDEVLDTNLKGVFLSTKAVAPHMIAAKGGKIIITGSINSFAGVPGAAHYVAAKHGIAGLAKVLAIELAPHGINVNYVCPTAVNTTMIEAMAAPDVPEDYGERLVAATGSWNMLEEGAPPLEAEEVTQAVLWLASDASDFVTGSPVVVDAGFLAK
jgi:(+)-trans-carveol dehydrogenase